MCKIPLSDNYLLMKNYNEADIEAILKENSELHKKIEQLELYNTDLYHFIIGDKEKRIKELFKYAPIGVATVKIGDKIISANPFFCDMLGYSEEELKQLSVKDITVAEDYFSEREIIDRIHSNNNHSTQIEKRYYTKQGEIVWCNLIFILFSDDENNKYGLGFVENITEQKLKDEALKESEAKFESIFNGINDSVFMHNSTPVDFNYFIEVNQVACNRYGYSREEFLKLTPEDILYDKENNIQKVKDFVKKLDEHGKAQMEIMHVGKTGEVFPTEVNSNTFIYKNQKFILSVVRDISERVETEMKLNESKRQLSTLIDNLPGIAYRCQNDEYWTMDFISDATLAVTGYDANDILNNRKLSFNDIIIEEDRQHVKDIIEDTIYKHEKFNIKYRIETKSGEIKWMWEQGCAVYNEDSSISHIEGYITDITEAQNREKELIKAKEKAEESDRLKSTFLATMSHELRTPLNGIIGFSELLDKNTPPDQVEVYSNNILDCGKSLLSIIEDIFDLALLETETLNINTQSFKIFEIYLYNKTFIEDLLIKSGKSNDIELTYNPDEYIMDYFIESDKFKINQVLANLIKNAVKFTEKGNIELGFYSKDQKNITFYLKDTGIGIAPEHKDLIFDIFRQVDEGNEKSYGGTGIGLTISKMIAKALGGDLTLESEEGEGSTFYFTFPILHSKEIPVSNKKEIKEEENKLDLSHIKILIVEDEEINLFLLESILEEYNPQIIKAENGLEAVIKFHENQDLDIILMDIKMPMLDGFEATKKIRETNSSVPIIALTAYSYNEEIEKIKSCGFNSYIPKPYNKSELLSAIQELI